LTALVFIQGGSCNWYSFLTTFFVIAGVLWSMVLSRTVALVLNRDALSSRLTRLTNYAAIRGGPCRKWLANNIEGVRMLAFHTLVWGIAAVCSLSMTIQADEQRSISSWCWFDNTVANDDATIAARDATSTTESDTASSSPDIGQVCLFFAPIVISILYNLKALFWATCRRTCGALCSDRWRDVALMGHETNENVLQQHVEELISTLRYYIMLSVVVAVWLCVAEIVNFYDPSRQNIVWIYSVMLVMLRLHGFGNLMIYAGRKDVRLAWYKGAWDLMGWKIHLTDADLDGHKPHGEADGARGSMDDEDGWGHGEDGSDSALKAPLGGRGESGFSADSDLDNKYTLSAASVYDHDYGDDLITPLNEDKERRSQSGSDFGMDGQTHSDRRNAGAQPVRYSTASADTRSTAGSVHSIGSTGSTPRESITVDITDDEEERSMRGSYNTAVNAASASSSAYANYLPPSDGSPSLGTHAQTNNPIKSLARTPL